MPAVAIGAVSMWGGMGAVAAAGGWGAIGMGLAGGAGWMGFASALAAGATVAGGAATLLGAATGDKKLQEDGMLVAAVGGVATAGLGTDVLAKASAEQAASGTANMAQAASETTTPLNGSVAPKADTIIGGITNQPTTPTLGDKVSMGGLQAPSVAGAPTTESAMIAKYDALIKSNAQQNLIAQTVGGLGQGYQAKVTADAAEARLDEEKRRYDTEYANRNNIAQMRVPTPVLPKLYQPANGMLQATTQYQPNIVLSNGAAGMQPPLPQTINPANLPKRI